MKLVPTILPAMTALALSVSAAHAFTVENKDAGAYATPEFNLDDQLKHFRKDGTASSAGNGKYQFDGMFGKGTIEFGAQPHSNFGSSLGPGSAFGSSGYGPTRRDFDRVTAPPTSLDYNR